MIAAKKGDNNIKSITYINLAKCYKQIDYVNMNSEQTDERIKKAKKYYLLAIETDKRNIMAMYKLAICYWGYTRDSAERESNTKKYFLMAAKNHHKQTIIDFIKSRWYPLEFIITIEWFRLFIENQDILEINDIYKAFLLLSRRDFNEKERKEFFELISQIKNNEKMPFLLETLINLINYDVDVMELHSEYSSKGKGYEDAKIDFISKILS